jgi:hypothetical protein
MGCTEDWQAKIGRREQKGLAGKRRREACMVVEGPRC